MLHEKSMRCCTLKNNGSWRVTTYLFVICIQLVTSIANAPNKVDVFLHAFYAMLTAAATHHLGFCVSS